MKVIILRGLSGSGKSHYTNTISADKQSVAVFSADFYFIKNGEYKFNPRLLGAAHQACFTQFKDCVEAGCADIVIVDNTNSTWWEIEKYYNVANEYCDVEVVWVDTDKEICKKRNTHNVPPETIDKMAERFLTPLPAFVKQTIIKGS